MGLAPWDAAPSHEQLFVLVTGSNSGVGLGIGERLMDEFLATRSLTSHLILIPTTRSVSKSRATVEELRAHLRTVAQTSPALRARAGPTYNWKDTVARVHVLSIQLDLCNLPNVYQVANRLRHGTFSNPPRADGSPDALSHVQVPRLDAVIFNAGFGGWTGLDWFKLWRSLFTKGIVQSCTWPDFKAALPGAVLSPVPVGSDQPTSAVLGEVFCANVFGHYMFAHQLLPMLSRTPADKDRPGRIIWTSSVEPTAHHLSMEDFQGILTDGPYESSKRLTDLLALTCTLPGVSKFSDSYFSTADSKDMDGLTVRPRIYVTHPGVVASALFPLSAFLFFFYKLAMILTRYLGSPWHGVTGYRGAVAPVWMALEEQSTLDSLHAERIKWGSACDRLRRTFVKKTEVEGWGWEGKVEDREALAKDPATGVLRKMVGRSADAVDLTEEKREEFEATGAECWKEMERLRLEWEDTLGVKK